jgi:putative endonuclease
MNSGIFSVYALVNIKENHIYVGISREVDRRVKEHNAGKVFSTKPFRPWLKFFSQSAGSSAEARKLEKYYKSASGKRRLRKILNDLNPGSLPD